MNAAIEIIPGDNRASLRRLIDAGVRVHSVVTDPPYGLTSVTKRLGGEGSTPIVQGTDGAYARASKGFMGKTWDGSGIERDPEFWRLVWEILLPGAYCVAFSSSRTGHWQACAMESAGFVMHPMLGWVFGQGFPKAHNASKAIDRELGAERERVPVEQTPGWQRNIGNVRPYMSDPNHTTVNGVPVTAAAAAWEGWAYGGQALKPALEPIYVGQKPFSEKNGALNLLKHGVGAINIDSCRVPAPDGVPKFNQKGNESAGIFSDGLNGSKRTGEMDVSTGRHPANLLHDGSPEVVALFPQTPGQIAKASSSETRKTQNVYGEMARGNDGAEPRGDAGSAARFFNTFPPDADPIFYQPKATKADRAGSKHPTVKPIALMRWLCRLVTPPGGMVLDPFGGSGTTAEAARLEGFDCTLMEAEPDYVRDLYRRFPVEGGIFG